MSDPETIAGLGRPWPAGDTGSRVEAPRFHGQACLHEWVQKKVRAPGLRNGGRGLFWSEVVGKRPAATKIYRPAIRANNEDPRDLLRW